MNTIEMITAGAGAVGAVATAIVVAWTKLAPVITEMIELVRGTSAAVGGHPESTSVVDCVKDLERNVMLRLDTQAARLSELEVTVRKLDCQTCPSTALRQ